MPEEDNAIAIFRLEPKFDGAASKKEGRPVYREVAWVEIIIPGNNRDIVDRPVTDDDKNRFPMQWANFQNQREEPLEGTPIKEAPWLGRAQVAMLEHLNILTVENLAGIGDVEIQNLGPGGRDLVAKAKNWIEMAKEGAVNNAAISEMKLLRAENEELNEKINALMAKVANMADPEDTPAKSPAPKRATRTRTPVEENVDG